MGVGVDARVCVWFDVGVSVVSGVGVATRVGVGAMWVPEEEPLA